MYLEEAFAELNKKIKLKESIDDDDTTYTKVRVPDITIKNKSNEDIILSFTGWYDSFSDYEYLIPIISITFENKTFYLRPFLDEPDFSNFDYDVTDSWDAEYYYGDYGTYKVYDAGCKFEITWKGQKFTYDPDWYYPFESTIDNDKIGISDIEDLGDCDEYYTYLNVDEKKFLDALLKISNDAANSILKEDKDLIAQIEDDCNEYFKDRLREDNPPPVD